ncbi:hypothetical protein CBM2633_U10115 [Cupriavidus taiwanensis]|uniref:hypothetical protein n=1 Tax=Cupriavidus taiwanensis TaxID=164546 RepID=UPI000E15EF76|nr:hypothetical protein [Cupriavidus taiwanensis]SPA23771.1 hypothetical protein CBM2633_U10115 [Cupriavidus taiwanensis]
MLDSGEVLKVFKKQNATAMPVGTLRGALQNEGYSGDEIADGIHQAIADRTLVEEALILREGQRLADYADTFIGLTDTRLTGDERNVLLALVSANMRSPGTYTVTEEVSKLYDLTPAALGKLMAASNARNRRPYSMPMIIDTIGTFGTPGSERFPDLHGPFDFKLAVHIIE